MTEGLDSSSQVRQTLVQMRERLGLSQGRLAKRIGSTQGQISSFENGLRPTSRDLVFRLASLANPSEANTFFSFQGLRGNNVLKLINGATAMLEAFSKWDQTPQEARQLLGEFLPRWRSWLDSQNP